MNKREDDLKYRRSVKGLITKIYSHQKEKSMKRGHPRPTYNKCEFVDWILETNFIELHHNWVQSNYDKRYTPSVDRLDDNKGYSLSNIRVTTWEENNTKNHKGRIDGTSRGNMRSIKMVYGDKEKTFKSIAEASRHIAQVSGNNNINSIKAGISKVVGRIENRTTAFGCEWSYTDE